MSLDRRAMTGAAPVPVPPPMPARGPRYSGVREGAPAHPCCPPPWRSTPLMAGGVFVLLRMRYPPWQGIGTAPSCTSLLPLSLNPTIIAAGAPAVMKTMSAPLTAAAISWWLSCAASSPSSGLPPVPGRADGRAKS